jgi:predicted GNAT family acetyltransferase
LWAVMTSDNEVVGLGMHTPPFALFLSAMPSAAASALALALADARRSLPGANGELNAVRAFSDSWAAITGQENERTESMRLYRLEGSVVAQPTTGAARTAVPDDLGVVTKWMTDFHDEVDPHGPASEVAGNAKRRVLAGHVVLWIDGGRPVALAARTRPAKAVVRIGPVFTPFEERRRGYGAAVTAAASQLARTEGASEVVLYTDLANPTSNAIYQRIGYVPVCDAERHRFI